MNGITLGRVSTDVLVMILWRFDHSGGIYRTVANVQTVEGDSMLKLYSVSPKPLWVHEEKTTKGFS